MWKRDCLNNGKTDSLGARAPHGRTDGWTEGDGTRGPARQHPHGIPTPLGALLRQEEQQEKGRGGCRRDAVQSPCPEPATLAPKCL